MKEFEAFNEWNPSQQQEIAEDRLRADQVPCAEDALPEQTEPLFAELRKESNAQGGALLIYHVIMNFVVIVAMLVVAFVEIFRQATGAETDVQDIADAVLAGAGWGYLVAVSIGLLILLLWKKPSFFRHTILQKGRPMTVGALFALLSLTMSAQMVAQVGNLGLMWLLELLGMDGSALDQLASVDTSSLGMFLYIGIAAPISEELLFRGLLLRSVAPYSKKLAVIGSAILFGLYHANPIQTPYAILVGLVLGYVALEYHVIWAIAFHLFNNLVFALLLPEALSFLPAEVVDGILWALIIGFFIAAVAIVLAKRRQVAALWKSEPMEPWQRHAFFRAPTIVVLIVLCLINTVSTVLLLLMQ